MSAQIQPSSPSHRRSQQGYANDVQLKHRVVTVHKHLANRQGCNS